MGVAATGFVAEAAAADVAAKSTVLVAFEADAAAPFDGVDCTAGA